MMPLTLGALTAALVAEATATPSEAGVGAGRAVLDRLVGWLRRVFAADDVKEAAAALGRVVDAPDGLVELAYVLNVRADADAGFRSDLMVLVEEARSAGVDIGSITQTAWGARNEPGVESFGSDTTRSGPLPAGGSELRL